MASLPQLQPSHDDRTILARYRESDYGVIGGNVYQKVPALCPPRMARQGEKPGFAEKHRFAVAAFVHRRRRTKTGASAPGNEPVSIGNAAWQRRAPNLS